MKHPAHRCQSLLTTATASLAALIAGCASSPFPTARTPDSAPPPLSTAYPATTATPLKKISGATNARDYRRDAARHLYEQNADRIFKGKMPPLLYAIGVLQVEVNSTGHVTGTHWMRNPSHAPEVVADIERTVRQAAPFPVPARMGRVTYTDTWLWHSSGHFQLDTLTEGQL
jgi:protein TonB